MSFFSFSFFLPLSVDPYSLLNLVLRKLPVSAGWIRSAVMLRLDGPVDLRQFSTVALTGASVVSDAGR